MIMPLHCIITIAMFLFLTVEVDGQFTRNLSNPSAIKRGFKVVCPKGYQAFHTFQGPIDEYRYNAENHVDCVKYENEDCPEKCYWASASFDRTRGDCGYFFDIWIKNKDIYHEGNKTVYAAGFEFNGAKVDRAYCCISSATRVLIGSCQRRFSFTSYNQSSTVNISSLFPQLTNPITRSVDVKRHTRGYYFDYVFEVCDSKYVSPEKEAQCNPHYKPSTTPTNIENGSTTFKIVCPPGYQAFHTFHGPIKEENYNPEDYVDCVKYEESSCQERCYWAGEFLGFPSGDCGFWHDVRVTDKTIYFEGKKAVYVNGFEFRGINTIDGAYCCISNGSTVVNRSCQSRVMYSSLNASSLNINSHFPGLINPITRSVDVKKHNGQGFNYVLEVCDTEYSPGKEAMCTPGLNKTYANCSFTSEISQAFLHESPCHQDSGCTAGAPCTCEISNGDYFAMSENVCGSLVSLVDTSDNCFSKFIVKPQLNCSDGALSVSGFGDAGTYYPAAPDPHPNIKHIKCAACN